MTKTLTTDELRQIVASAKTSLEQYLALELLANRETKPVGYVSASTLNCLKSMQTHEIITAKPEKDAVNERDWDVIPVYTAPPAPVVVKLPTEFYSDEGVVVRLEEVMAALALVGVKYERKSNACRAAMLAQPVSQVCKLPEGFKLMPIEITDEIAEAIAMEARCCGGIALCIYEAALAAAPEGGK